MNTERVSIGERGCGGVEARHRAKIDQRRIDALAAAQRGHGVGCAGADADVVHEHVVARRGFDHVGGFEFEHAVRADQLHVRAARQHAPVQARAFDACRR